MCLKAAATIGRIEKPVAEESICGLVSSTAGCVYSFSSTAYVLVQPIIEASTEVHKAQGIAFGEVKSESNFCGVPRVTLRSSRLIRSGSRAAMPGSASLLVNNLAVGDCVWHFATHILLHGSLLLG